MIDVRDVVAWVNSTTHEVLGKSEDDARHQASSHRYTQLWTDL